MRIAICDDEQAYRENIHKELRGLYRSLDVFIDIYENGQNLVAACEKTKYDLIILDIEMPVLNGFEVAKIIKKNYPNVIIIFLTSHTELAMDGYEVAAFRFLAKPIDKTKLWNALKDAEAVMQKENKICIIDNGIEEYINCKDIIFIKCENVYLEIFEKDKKHLIRKKLKDMLSELPEEMFLNVHRSFIVNLHNVESYSGNEIKMNNGISIPVSKKNKEIFKEHMIRFIREN